MIYFLFILSSLACFRLTRLITDDKITDFIRKFVKKEADKLSKGSKEKVKEGITCPFCVSFWIALLITSGLVIAGPVSLALAFLWLPAMWGASVLLNQIFMVLSSNS